MKPVRFDGSQSRCFRIENSLIVNNLDDHVRFRFGMGVVNDFTVVVFRKMNRVHAVDGPTDQRYATKEWIDRLLMKRVPDEETIVCHEIILICVCVQCCPASVDHLFVFKLVNRNFDEIGMIFVQNVIFANAQICTVKAIAKCNAAFVQMAQ